MGEFLLRQVKLFLGIAALCAPLCALTYFISKEYFDEILVGIFITYIFLLVIFVFKIIKLLLGFKDEDKKPVWEQILTWLSNMLRPPRSKQDFTRQTPRPLLKFHPLASRVRPIEPRS